MAAFDSEPPPLDDGADSSITSTAAQQAPTHLHIRPDLVFAYEPPLPTPAAVAPSSDSVISHGVVLPTVSQHVTTTGSAEDETVVDEQKKEDADRNDADEPQRSSAASTMPPPPPPVEFADSDPIDPTTLVRRVGGAAWYDDGFSGTRPAPPDAANAAALVVMLEAERLADQRASQEAPPPVHFDPASEHRWQAQGAEVTNDSDDDAAATNDDLAPSDVQEEEKDQQRPPSNGITTDDRSSRPLDRTTIDDDVVPPSSSAAAAAGFLPRRQRRRRRHRADAAGAVGSRSASSSATDDDDGVDGASQAASGTFHEQYHRHPCRDEEVLGARRPPRRSRNAAGGAALDGREGLRDDTQQQPVPAEEGGERSAAMAAAAAEHQHSPNVFMLDGAEIAVPSRSEVELALAARSPAFRRCDEDDGDLAIGRGDSDDDDLEGCSRAAAVAEQSSNPDGAAAVPGDEPPPCPPAPLLASASAGYDDEDDPQLLAPVTTIVNRATQNDGDDGVDVVGEGISRDGAHRDEVTDDGDAGAISALLEMHAARTADFTAIIENLTAQVASLSEENVDLAQENERLRGVVSSSKERRALLAAKLQGAHREALNLGSRFRSSAKAIRSSLHTTQEACGATVSRLIGNAIQAFVSRMKEEHEDELISADDARRVAEQRADILAEEIARTNAVQGTVSYFSEPPGAVRAGRISLAPAHAQVRLFVVVAGVKIITMAPLHISVVAFKRIILNRAVRQRLLQPPPSFDRKASESAFAASQQDAVYYQLLLGDVVLFDEDVLADIGVGECSELAFAPWAAAPTDQATVTVAPQQQPFAASRAVPPSLSPLARQSEQPAAAPPAKSSSSSAVPWYSTSTIIAASPNSGSTVTTQQAPKANDHSAPRIGSGPVPAGVAPAPPQAVVSDFSELFAAVVVDTARRDEIESYENLDRRLLVETARIEFQPILQQESQQRRNVYKRMVEDIRAKLRDRATFGTSEEHRGVARDCLQRLDDVMNRDAADHEIQRAIDFAKSAITVVPAHVDEAARVSSRRAAAEAQQRRRNTIINDIKSLIEVVRMKLRVPEELWARAETLTSRGHTCVVLADNMSLDELQECWTSLNGFVAAVQQKNTGPGTVR